MISNNDVITPPQYLKAFQFFNFLVNSLSASLGLRLLLKKLCNCRILLYQGILNEFLAFIKLA